MHKRADADLKVIAYRLRDIFTTEINLVTEIAQAHQTCKRKAVGCSIGYLIPPIPPDNAFTFKRLVAARNGCSERQSVIRCTGERGNCGCSHAEPKACIHLSEIVGEHAYWKHRKLPINLPAVFRKKLILVCNYSPCTNCANIIASTWGISTVVFQHITEHDLRGIEILKEVCHVWHLPSELPCMFWEHDQVNQAD